MIVELRLERAQAERAAAEVEHAGALGQPRQREEALVAAGSSAGGEGGGEARERAARGGVDAGHRRIQPMASKRQIHVGAVPIGGGAPVAVQTMTKTETANLARDDGADPHGRRGRRRHRARRGAARAGRGGAEDDRRRVADPDHRRHPLQPHARAEGDRSGRALRAPEPGQHRRPREGRRGDRAGQASTARRCASASTPARCPSTCASSSTRTRSRRS